MSQIHNDLRLQGIDELRQVFKLIPPQNKSSTQSGEIQQIELLKQYNLNPFDNLLTICNSIRSTDSKSGNQKRRRKNVSVQHKQFKVQETASRNLKRVESPKMILKQN
ncbi:unnamed protein product [Paramecium octaurelia]|uniref:Uncharacterized protein n=1 Tax=Paramecium octaurelia TaxID=43137 RepID=A0A8S1XSJ7_PAROT|nr:unnamed protein product [Paramecium octaurelia]